jgi:hypothetical protein
MDIEVQVQGDARFYENLQMMMASSKRTAMEVAHTHFKGVVRNFLSITPPCGGRGPTLKFNAKGEHSGAVDYDAGLKAGRAAMRSDIKKAFWQMEDGKVETQTRWKASVTQQMLNETPIQTLTWYLKMRNKRKRIPRKIGRPASKKNVDFVLETLYRRQGTMLAGWTNAAKFYGIPMASWVRRWGPQRSRFQVEAGKDLYYIFAENQTSFDDAPRIKSMAGIAMNMQANNMKRVLDRYIKDEAKRRGFITR